jgi:3-phosphoshikimate 1-carboxyvinyltransferase
LSKLGVKCAETDNGIIIYPGIPKSSIVDTYDDHRMAMAFSLIGLRIEDIRIANPACTAKTFENYFEVLEGLQ